MKKKYFRIICAFLVLCLLFSGCTAEGGGDGQTVAGEGANRENILKAWDGEFSEDVLKDAIAEYRSNYQPVVGALPVTIEADFDIESYTVSRISKVDDSDVEVELNGYIDLIIDTARDGRRITVNTDWWQWAGEKTQRYTVWSYLVLVRDTEGGEHYYYFRVDYSSETARTRETAEVTEPDYNTMQGASIEYLTARDFNPDRTAGKVSAEFRSAAADFAFRLLNESRSEYEGDALLISPLSAMIALAMTANGAEGKTLAQMEQVLGGMYIGDLNEQLFNYTSSLTSSENAKFNLANAVWVTSNPSFSINRNFVKCVDNTFDADVVSADLPNSVDAINDWVNKETFGMIPEILGKGDLDSDTVMVLLNALAFDALWAQQPSDSSCYNGTFAGVDGKQTVRYMRADANAYIEGKNEVGIVKNYKGGNYAFLALLPNENISIYDYVSSLSGEDFLALYDGRITASLGIEVNAKMPHFKFDCNIFLANVLKKMGMTDAFSSALADFDGLGQDSRGPLYISAALQKTHIDLDNSGTRAAAVTAIEISTECAPSQYYSVNLDRPFVYAIIDTQNGLPVFLGICDNIK